MIPRTLSAVDEIVMLQDMYCRTIEADVRNREAVLLAAWHYRRTMRRLSGLNIIARKQSASVIRSLALGISGELKMKKEIT